LKLLRKNKFTSLSSAIKKAEQCNILELQFIEFNLKDYGYDFLKLKNLKELYIQGDPKIYEMSDFELPHEIGKLNNLKVLSLLNLPIQQIPDWTENLMEIKYLMVRGTDVTTIPEFITKFKNLKTLRIENCPLTKLPVGLKSMTNLRELGLCDTQLTDLNPKIFPKKLKRLNFSGTDSYKKTDLENLKKSLRKTKVYPRLILESAANRIDG
jgi:hypothetical protein